MISIKNALQNFLEQVNCDEAQKGTIFAIVERLLKDPTSQTYGKTDIKLVAKGLQIKMDYFLNLVKGGSGHLPTKTDIENLIVSQLIIELSENPLCNTGLKLTKLEALLQLLIRLSTSEYYESEKVLSDLDNIYAGWADRRSLPSEKLQSMFPSRIGKIRDALAHCSPSAVPGWTIVPSESSVAAVNSLGATPHQQSGYDSTQIARLLAQMEEMQKRITTLERSAPGAQ